jgi:polyisoprenoid-binding protein YceI
MLRSIYFSLCLLLFTAGYAQPEWAIVDSEITFEIDNAGVTVDGSLGEPYGEIRFDPTDLSPASLQASVKVRSLETGISARDHHLMAKKYFYADQYPEISLRSTNITKRNANTFDGVFQLTIKGNSRTVSFPFTFRRDQNQGYFDGEFTIDRLNYDVGSESFFLDDQVRIQLRVNVKPIAPAGTEKSR